MALTRLASALAKHLNRSVSTVSRLATGSGETIPRLGRGHAITTRRAARAIQWFSDHWPADAEWPAAIPRPQPTPVEPVEPEAVEEAPAGAGGQVEEPVA